MINIAVDEIMSIKNKIQTLIKQGLYGEATKTINALSPELRDNVMLWSDDDGWFLCGLQSGICCDDCGENGGYTCCGCFLCGIGIVTTCFGMDCADSICGWITDGAVNLTEKLCCNDCFC